jgi:hypothetical protein
MAQARARVVLLVSLFMVTSFFGLVGFQWCVRGRSSTTQGERRRKKTVGLAGSMGVTNCVDETLPGTSDQFAEIPVLSELVCACKIQPRWLAGHASVSCPALTL